MRAAPLLVLLVACSRATAPDAPAPSSPALDGSEAAKVGDRMAPITSPLAIPVKGAKLTMVNYFATWCGSSQKWMPHVEEMRKKYAGSGLAVVGVGNYDEAPQATLEAVAKDWGASFPIFADGDHRIGKALPPSGWGQAIVVVDAEGIVRLVHRGTREGAFEAVDAELGRLLAP